MWNADAKLVRTQSRSRAMRADRRPDDTHVMNGRESTPRHDPQEGRVQTFAPFYLAAPENTNFFEIVCETAFLIYIHSYVAYLPLIDALYYFPSIRRVCRLPIRLRA